MASTNENFVPDQPTQSTMNINPTDQSLNQANQPISNNYNINVINHNIPFDPARPHQCQTCGMRFKSKKVLWSHHLIHLSPSQRPFGCSFCPKRFNTRRQLKTHERTHTNDKPFKCNECNKRFSDESALRRHRRIHTKDKPFKCDECSKRFTQSGNLTKHRRIHTGDTPYKCTECGRAFSESHSLTIHMRTHTGEKPYKCPHCDYACAQSTHLRQHVRVVHKLELPKFEQHGRKRTGAVNRAGTSQNTSTTTNTRATKLKQVKVTTTAQSKCEHADIMSSLRQQWVGANQTLMDAGGQQEAVTYSYNAPLAMNYGYAAPRHSYKQIDNAIDKTPTKFNVYGNGLLPPVSSVNEHYGSPYRPNNPNASTDENYGYGGSTPKQKNPVSYQVPFVGYIEAGEHPNQTGRGESPKTYMDL